MSLRIGFMTCDCTDFLMAVKTKFPAAEIPPPMIMTRRSTVFKTEPSATPRSVPAYVNISRASLSPFSAASEMYFGSTFEGSPPTSVRMRDRGFDFRRSIVL